MDEVAEGGTLIYLAVTEEELAPRLSFFQSEEYGLYYILYIDEGDILTLEAHGKVAMSFDTFCHNEIVLLSGTIDTCRS